MATITDKLKLNKPDTTDKITPVPYNENFDVIDDEISALKTDYVIAQGVQDNWTYRRWANGIAECWGTIDIFNANDFAAGGNFSLPFTFASVSTTIATVGNGNFSNSYRSLDINVKAWSNANTVTLWANSKDAAFGDYNPVPISVEVKGRWK